MELVATAKNVTDRRTDCCFCIRAMVVAVGSWVSVALLAQVSHVAPMAPVPLDGGSGGPAKNISDRQTGKLLHQGNSDGSLVVGLGWG